MLRGRAIFGRPLPEPLPRFGESDFEIRDHMWVAEQESRRRYRCCTRPRQHADATIDIDAPGFVPCSPRPDVKLFNVMVQGVHINSADPWTSGRWSGLDIGSKLAMTVKAGYPRHGPDGSVA